MCIVHVQAELLYIKDPSERERVFICHSGSRPEGAMPINAGDQTTKREKNTEIQVQQYRLDMLQINTYNHFIIHTIIHKCRQNQYVL